MFSCDFYMGAMVIAALDHASRRTRPWVDERHAGVRRLPQLGYQHRQRYLLLNWQRDKGDRQYS